MKGVWLATNGERVWALAHEADYTEGDTLVLVEPGINNELTLTIRPTEVIESTCEEVPS
jgi:hypothetical protein